MSEVVRTEAGGGYSSAYSLIIDLPMLSSVYLICKFGVLQSCSSSFIPERLPLRVRKSPYTFLPAV
jgi:hypothetical protein